MTEEKEKIEVLNQRFENQIEKMLDTIVEIQELEKSYWPAPFLSDWSEKALSMCFFHIITKYIWKKCEPLDIKQRQEYMLDVANMTHEHFLNLYWFDTKKEI